MSGAAPDPLDRARAAIQAGIDSDSGEYTLQEEAEKALVALVEVARAARAFETWQPGTERAMKYLHPQERGALLELRAALARLERTP